jgi:pimeloyl-ACP methyl ester carboxylesterase
VHGYASNSCGWGDAFFSTIKAPRPDGFVYTLDYGLPGLPNCATLNAAGEPLSYLAFNLDNLLSTQVEDHEGGMFAGWAFTRYDLVGHSQGGVLARMLCQNFPPTVLGTGAPYSMAKVVSKSNANRGRFRRVITIGSPQSGSTILRYVLQLDQKLGSYARLIPFSRTLLQAKFEPYAGEISLINSQYSVDERIKFHSIRTKIGQSTTPFFYKVLGLPSTPPDDTRTRLKILLPEGSDGIVDFASQIAGSTKHTDYLPFDISHADGQVVGFDVFGVAPDHTQTVSYDVGVKVQTLLTGLSSNFAKFVPPAPVSVPSKAEVDSIAAT